MAYGNAGGLRADDDEMQVCGSPLARRAAERQGRGRGRSRVAIGLLAGLGALAVSQGAQAADWLVRVQAIGGADGSYNFCGSSDGAVNCSAVDGDASGAVIYANGMTTITAQGEVRGRSNPASIASGQITADLATATIHQENGNTISSSSTDGHLTDQLTFDLADPSQVYALGFSYSFEGDLSGDTVGDYHPGLFTRTSLELGSSSIGGSQSIGESGPAYYPPSIGSVSGSQWTNVVVTQSMYGYSVSGDLLIGGAWGDTLTFDMQSQVSCANEYGAASCDFSHTQVFDFDDLPSGVSFTSASGVFLTGDQATGGVPEPATWALMIAGFGLAGAALRKARDSASPIGATPR